MAFRTLKKALRLLKSLRNKRQTSQAQDFHLFPFLPVEIQLLIWEEAMDALHGNVFKVKIITLPGSLYETVAIPNYILPDLARACHNPHTIFTRTLRSYRFSNAHLPLHPNIFQLSPASDITYWPLETLKHIHAGYENLVSILIDAPNIPALAPSTSYQEANVRRPAFLNFLADVQYLRHFETVGLVLPKSELGNREAGRIVTVMLRLLNNRIDEAKQRWTQRLLFPMVGGGAHNETDSWRLRNFYFVLKNEEGFSRLLDD